MCSTAFFAITVVFCMGLQGINSASTRLPPPPSQDQIQWPKACENKSYCMLSKDERPANYPVRNFEILLQAKGPIEIDLTPGLENRSGFFDVAGCRHMSRIDPIYMIKDDNNMVRFVANSDNKLHKFKYIVGIEECANPGVVLKAHHLKWKTLLNQSVSCFEKKEPIVFPVLSLDGQSIESVSPKGGIPLSCSAKIIQTRP